MRNQAWVQARVTGYTSCYIATAYQHKPGMGPSVILDNANNCLIKSHFLTLSLQNTSI